MAGWFGGVEERETGREMEKKRERSSRRGKEHEE
jgi:hypothetical protein